MWRSLFIACGVMAIIVGFECLVIDSASFYSGAAESNSSSMANFFDPTGAPAPGTQEWRPSEWMPWTVLSMGAIVVVYAFTLPSRWGGGCSNCS